MRTSLSVLFALLIFTLAACNGGSSEYEAGAPDGWRSEEDRWWQESVDTSRAFRDLESFEAMGVDDPDVTYASSAGGVSEDRGALVESVKQSLVRMYRNHPEVVDSLFAEVVLPRIQRASLSDDPRENVDRLKREGYQALTRNFQEPRTRLSLGEDIPVVYPDSLRRQNISGTVRTQVYLDEEGNPRAVKLVDSVHPVLDDIAMQATTQMRWRPAYLLRRGQWNEIPSWSRFNINFSSGE